jgi:hypothetical protein
MSASPPIASKLRRRSESTWCAKTCREHMQQRASPSRSPLGDAERCGGASRPHQLCRLQVDDELEFAGLHDGEVSRSLTPEDAADVDADLAILLAQPRTSSARRLRQTHENQTSSAAQARRQGQEARRLRKTSDDAFRAKTSMESRGAAYYCFRRSHHDRRSSGLISVQEMACSTRAK